MPATEFDRWLAYDRVEPVDLAMRVELAMGIAASVTAASAGASGVTAADYMVDWHDRLTRRAVEAGQPDPLLINKLKAFFG